MFVGDDKRHLKHLTGALSGTNCGQRCIANRAGTMCWAPRIIGWSCAKLIVAAPTGADVNSDGNSFNWFCRKSGFYLFILVGLR
jgi:hypothetical protein